MADGIYYNPEPQLLVGTVSVDNKTVSGNGYQSFGLTATKTGYTPLGLVGWAIENASSSGGQGSFCFMYRYYINSSGIVQAFVRNTSSNDANIKITAYVLYRKV